MRKIEQHNHFKRDLKREAHGQHRQALKVDFVTLLTVLAKDESPAAKYHDHELIGDWLGYRECHIKPDLLLIYRRVEPDTLWLVRLGSHSQLFG